MFSVSDRIAVSGDLGTVRYVGAIPVWGDHVLAYGVEWDDHARGKNSGEIGGFRYFSTKVPGAGSFLKASNKKIEPPVSFLDAVYRRYAGDENQKALSESVVFGSKVVENYGFGRLNEISKNVAQLRVVMVDRLNIKNAGSGRGAVLGGVSESTAVSFGAEALDLSSNLLTDWEEVRKILSLFPRLKSVNLNGNRLGELPKLGPTASFSFAGSREVHLSATFISPMVLSHLDLPNVTKLGLSGNAYTESSLENWPVPPKLASLDLSFNALEQIPNTLSNVTELILADNQIASVTQMPVFTKVKILDLRRNPISSFAEIDVLGEKFPSLCELRINDCAVFSNASPDEMSVNLIGRLECEPWTGKTTNCISKLNGSFLSEHEITNAELYFISRVKSGDLAISNTRRWHALLAKYRLSDQTTKKSAIDERKVRLSIRKATEPDTELFSRVFLQKNTVLRLKGIVARHAKRFILDFSLFYYVNDDSAFGSQQILDNDIASLQSLGLTQNHRIYVL